MKISREHYCHGEVWDGPDYEHDKRLARRLKRRSIADELNHKYWGNGSRTSSKKFCNSAEKETTENDADAEEDEVDHDYKYFLDTRVHILDTFYDSAGGFDFDDDKSCESDNDADADPNFKMFMDNLREDGNSYVLEVFENNQRVRVKYEEKQVENLSDGLKSDTPYRRSGSDLSLPGKQKCNSEVQCDLLDEDYLGFLNSIATVSKSMEYVSKSGVKRVYGESGSRSTKLGSSTESRKGLGTKRGVSKKEGNSSIAGQKVQVSNEEIGAHKRPCPSVPCSAKNKCSNELKCNDVDEDYENFLCLSRFDSDGFVYMSNGSNTKVYEHESGSTSDSEVVIVEPDQFDEDTPFVPASNYDKSCCENPENPAVGHPRAMAMCAIYSSQFRERLVQKLKRPYDETEYEGYWQEVSRRRQKERHMEGREGRTKSVPLDGFDKSYLEVYPSLAQAIDQAKDPHKELFLLRGFFFWLKHQPHEGAFRPWLDKSCLEMLQKL